MVNPLLGAKVLYPKTLENRDNERQERQSLKSTSNSVGNSNSSLNTESSSPVTASKKLQRPLSMVTHSNTDLDPDFEDLYQLRAQRYRYSYGGQRLESVQEKHSISSSLASLLDDGFEMAAVQERV